MMLDPSKMVKDIMNKKGAGKAPKDKPAKLTEDTDGDLDPRDMAAEDVISAIHSKSPAKTKAALAAFFDLHVGRTDSDGMGFDE